MLNSTPRDLENLLANTEKSKVLLVSPRLRNGRFVVSMLVNVEQNCLYYALNIEDDNLVTFLNDLVESVRTVDAGFGVQTNQAVARDAAPDELVEAFLSDINRLSPKPRYIIFDDFDFLQMKDNTTEHQFFLYLSKKMPKGIQLVISSRFLTYSSWYDLVSRGTAHVIGDTETLTGHIFDTEKPRRPQLEVYGLSGGSVFMNGSPITSWDGPLPRNLFFYFIDHPMVTRDEIFKTFWPELSVKEATNVFHVTKRKVSEKVGHELTTYAGGFYKPSVDLNLHYDVAQFEKIVEQCKFSSPTDPEVWIKAIRLYRSPFLSKFDMPWMLKRREDLRQMYAECLVGAARLFKENQEHEPAVNYFLRALGEIPEREDIHRDLMVIYDERGETDKVQAQYKILTDLLSKSFGITPSKTTVNLYNKLVGRK
jgi:DNA-binding SARP family transcriptional activator